MLSSLNRDPQFFDIKLSPDTGLPQGGGSVPLFDKIEVTQESLTKLKKHAIKILNRFDARECDEVIDVSEFYELVSKLVPAYSERLTTLPKKMNLLSALEIVNDVLGDLSHPNGRFIVLNHADGSAHAMDALTNTSTWARNEYLGEEYFTGDIQFIEKPGNVVGFSNGRFAFCDPKEAYQDSISAFQAYKYPCGPYAEVMSFLNQMIKHFNVSQDVYCKNFGVVGYYC